MDTTTSSPQFTDDKAQHRLTHQIACAWSATRPGTQPPEEWLSAAVTALTGAADSLLGTNAGDAASAVGKRPYAQLVFNFNNPLVRKLARVRDRAALTQCLQMLYVQSLLLGHHPLSAKEMALLNGGLTSLIEAAAATGGLSGSGGLKGAA